jgi:hypothetical protein
VGAAFVSLGSGDMLRLDAGNFELAVSTYPQLAVLFYDHGPASATITAKWEEVSHDKADSILFWPKSLCAWVNLDGRYMYVFIAGHASSTEHERMCPIPRLHPRKHHPP